MAPRGNHRERPEPDRPSRDNFCVYCLYLRTNPNNLQRRYALWQSTGCSAKFAILPTPKTGQRRAEASLRAGGRIARRIARSIAGRAAMHAAPIAANGTARHGAGAEKATGKGGCREAESCLNAGWIGRHCSEGPNNRTGAATTAIRRMGTTRGVVSGSALESVAFASRRANFRPEQRGRLCEQGHSQLRRATGLRGLRGAASRHLRRDDRRRTHLALSKHSRQTALHARRCAFVRKRRIGDLCQHHARRRQAVQNALRRAPAAGRTAVCARFPRTSLHQRKPGHRRGGLDRRGLPVSAGGDRKR